MLEKINILLSEISEAKVNGPEELESFRLRFLSKKGLISDLFEEFRNVPASDKKEIGQKLNILKQSALDKYNLLKSEMQVSDSGSSC